MIFIFTKLKNKKKPKQLKGHLLHQKILKYVKGNGIAEVEDSEGLEEAACFLYDSEHITAPQSQAFLTIKLGQWQQGR